MANLLTKVNNRIGNLLRICRTQLFGLKKGWYVLTYHQVSDISKPYLKHVGGIMSPKTFEQQINFLSNKFEFVSLEEGMSRYRNDKIDKPIFSVTFDDGFTSVREHALPILKKQQITGAQAVNSDFMQGKDSLWRIKLAALIESSAKDKLIQLLTPLGYQESTHIMTFTLDNFSVKLVEEISRLYEEHLPTETKAFVAQLFDSSRQISQLTQENWEICNHTKTHFPVAEKPGIHLMKEEFLDCQTVIREELNLEAKFWVLPFERVSKRSPDILKKFEIIAPKETTLIFVGNKINRTKNSNERTIYRIVPPNISGNPLLRFLGKMKYAS